MKAILSAILTASALCATAEPKAPVEADPTAQPAGARPAFRAEDFVDSIGLSASPFDRYLSDGRWAGSGTKYPPEMFFDLGVRHYRTGLCGPLSPTNQAALVTEWWRRTGAQVLLLVDPVRTRTVKTPWLHVEEDGDFSHLLSELRAYNPRAIGGVEAGNEVNNKFPPQDLALRYKGRSHEAAGSLYQRDLYAAIKGDPATAGIPVTMFSAIFTDYALARPCAAFDVFNTHPYQGGGSPSSSLLPNVTRTENILPAGSSIPPFWPTECGYNVEEDRSNHTGLSGSLRTQAHGIPMLLAEYFRHGIPRTYLFALHNADGYGLLESNQETRRPSWYALRSLVSLLSDAVWDSEAQEWRGAGRAFDPTALRFAVEGAPATVHTLTLQKSDGDWWLLVWNDVPLRNGPHDLNHASVPVRFRFASKTPVSCTALYRQGDLDTPGAPAENGAFSAVAEAPQVTKDGTMSLNVPACLLILRMHAASAPQVRLEAPAPSVARNVQSSESTLSFEVCVPALSGADSVMVFRQGMHVASIPVDPASPEETVIRFRDDTAWIRPGLVFRYELQSVSPAGTLGRRIPVMVETPDLRPNLVVGEFAPLGDEPAIRPGDAVRFAGTVRNAGDGATPGSAPENGSMYNSSVALTFRVDDNVVGWGSTSGSDPIPSGGAVHLESSAGPNGNGSWTATLGTHVVAAQADDIGRIASERSKRDNLASRTITVGDYPGRLSMESRPSPGFVRLNPAEFDDWVVFGAWDGKGTEHRRPGAGLIGPVSKVGGGYAAPNIGCAIRFAWPQDGEEPACDGTNVGLWTNGTGNGWEIRAPADQTERELVLYVGVTNGGHATFMADLSDRSAPMFADTTWNANRAPAWCPVADELAVRYAVRYRAASPGQQVIVRWTLVGEPDRFSAQCRLQAATLQSLP